MKKKVSETYAHTHRIMTTHKGAKLQWKKKKRLDHPSFNHRPKGKTERDDS